jgi:hypothetical protein
MDLQADVSIAGRQADVADLIHLRYLICDVPDLAKLNFEEYVCGDLVTNGTRVDDRSKLNHLILNEPVDSCAYGPLGDAELTGDISTWTPAILLQTGDNRTVDMIDNSGHDGNLPLRALEIQQFVERSANPPATRLRYWHGTHFPIVH